MQLICQTHLMHINITPSLRPQYIL